MATWAGAAGTALAPAAFELSAAFGVDLTVRVYGQIVAGFDTQGLVFARSVPLTLGAAS